MRKLGDAIDSYGKMYYDMLVGEHKIPEEEARLLEVGFKAGMKMGAMVTGNEGIRLMRESTRFLPVETDVDSIINQTDFFTKGINSFANEKD